MGCRRKNTLCLSLDFGANDGTLLPRLTRLETSPSPQKRVVLKFPTESDARQHGVYLFYIITKSLFYLKIFQHNAKAGILPRLCTKKKPFDVIWSFQNEAISLVAMRSKELWLVNWLVKKNRATVKPDPSVAPRWMKTYSESRIELRNLQILKKMLENQVSFCHRSSPVSRKAWTLPWKLQELKKYPRKTCGYSQPRSHLIRVLNEKSVNDGGDFCLLWLVILKSAWYGVGDTF